MVSVVTTHTKTYWAFAVCQALCLVLGGSMNKTEEFLESLHSTRAIAITHQHSFDQILEVSACKISNSKTSYL